MPRIRTIKPEFWSSPGVAKMGPWARLVFIGLWNWADDFGRGTFNARELLGFIFPHDENITVGEFRTHVGEIHTHVGVVFYSVAGRVYYAVPSWDRHQRIDRRLKGSKFPAPEEGIPWDPVSDSPLPAETELSENYADMSAGSAHMSAGSVESPGFSSVGTGEHRNIGTGEEGNAPARAGTREAAPAPPPLNFPNDNHTPDEWSTAADPRCRVHAHTPRFDLPACRGCAAARAWFQARENLVPRGTKARRAAIDACALCDAAGMRELSPGVVARCDHTPPSGQES